jgi:mRNA-degrading endonuclease toxin of MazEF toxin-antitoxin module
MEKDFLKWHEKKRWIHQEKARPFFKAREIWFCCLGANVGFEEDGSGAEFLRPVVIFKRFGRATFFGIPLTRTVRLGEYYFSCIVHNETNTALLSQGRSLDAKRLRYKIGEISKNDFDALRGRFFQLF